MKESIEHDNTQIVVVTADGMVHLHTFHEGSGAPRCTVLEPNQVDGAIEMLEQAKQAMREGR